LRDPQDAPRSAPIAAPALAVAAVTGIAAVFLYRRGKR
jgi:hypothetical protein